MHSKNIIKWIAAGLLLRVFLMFTTLHGQDLFYIHYFPMKFITQGAWNPYPLASTSLFPYTYYPPVCFYIVSIFQFLLQKIPYITQALNTAGQLMISPEPSTTLHYVQGLAHLPIFKVLFLLKTPYLLFDILCGVLIWKLAEHKEFSLKLWILNIIVLRSTYMVGQIDIFVAFFVILALWLAIKKRPYLCIMALSLGGAVKIAPYFLILPACLFLGQTLKKKFALGLTGLATIGLIYLPYGSSAICLFSRQGYQHSWLLMTLFLLAYGAICFNACLDHTKEKYLLNYFIATGLCIFIFSPPTWRYMLFLTPLFVLIFPVCKGIFKFMLTLIILVGLVKIHTIQGQLGLFAPLNPQLMSLPTIQEIMGAGELFYKTGTRIIWVFFCSITFWYLVIFWGLRRLRGEKL